MRRFSTIITLSTLVSILSPSWAGAYGDGRFGMAGDGSTTCNACHGGKTAPAVTVTGLDGWTQYQEQTMTIEVITKVQNPSASRRVGFGALLLPSQGQDSRSISFVSTPNGPELASGAEAVHFEPIPYTADGKLLIKLKGMAQTSGQFDLFLAVNDVDGDRTNRCGSNCPNGARYDQDDHPTNLVIPIEIAPGIAPMMDMPPDMSPSGMEPEDMSSTDVDMNPPSPDMAPTTTPDMSAPLRDMGQEDQSPSASPDMTSSAQDMASGDKKLLDSPSACSQSSLNSSAPSSSFLLMCAALLATLVGFRRREQ